MRKRGFGLAEALVSSALLLFMIGGTAQLLVVSLAAKASADFAFAAARCASARLEYLKSLAFDNPELQPGVSTPAVDDAAFPERLDATCRIEEVSPHMKKIVIAISDRYSPRRKQTYCLLLSRDLGF